MKFQSKSVKHFFYKLAFFPQGIGFTSIIPEPLLLWCMSHYKKMLLLLRSEPSRNPSKTKKTDPIYQWAGQQVCEIMNTFCLLQLFQGEILSPKQSTRNPVIKL